jgi:hypothetical protein
MGRLLNTCVLAAQKAPQVCHPTGFDAFPLW